MRLLWVSFAFIGGIASAGWIPVAAAYAYGAAALFLVGGFFVPHRETRLFFHLLPFALSAFCLGAGRYQAAHPVLTDPAFIASYNGSGESYTVVGVLAAPPDLRDAYANLRLQTSEIRLEERVRHTPVRGLLLARVDPVDAARFRYGDRLALTGKLETPPEDETFSYRDALARQGIYSFMSFARPARLAENQGSLPRTLLFAFRARALATVYRLFPDPEAALLAGILIGDETGLSPALEDAFRDTGTAHIIAISGFNITIIAGLFTGLFGRALGRRRGLVAAIAAIACYTLLVGGSPSVVRAAIMATLALSLSRTGRSAAPLGPLGFTAAVMAYFNPLLPWDAGFQLSFMATLGLVLYAPPLQAWAARQFSRYLPRAQAEKIAAPFSEFFLYSLAAQITTLPLLIYHFNRLSLTAPFVNPLILPVQPAVMIVGGLAVLAGSVFLPLGKLFAPFAWALAAYTIRVVEAVDKIPGGVVILGRAGVPVVIAIYGILFLSHWGVRTPGKGAAFLTRPVVAGFLALAAFVTWQNALAAPDGRLHLTLLDVGAGDALLIQTPTGRNLLIDGGSSPTRLSDALGRRLPLGQRGFDYWVIAAPFEPQIGALPRVLERFPPAAVLWAGPAASGADARFLRAQLAGAGVPLVQAETGYALDLGGGASLRVLAAGRRGAILLVEWNGFRAFLPIGADFDTLAALENGRAVGPVTLLLLAENGLNALAPPELLAALHPQLALLSAAPGRPPPAETLARLAGIRLLRTDENGWIRLTTDGASLWVEVERVPQVVK